MVLWIQIIINKRSYERFYYVIIYMVIIMFYTFEGIKNELRKNSESKIEYCIYGTYTGYTLYLVFLIIFLTSIIYYGTKIIPFWLFFGIYWVTIIYGIINIITRKCSLGMSNNSFTLIKYTRLLRKINTINEFNFDKIKMIEYKRLLNINKAEIIFEDNRKKLQRIKIVYSTKRWGIGFSEHKKHAEAISKKLIEMQKVLDKGDY